MKGIILIQFLELVEARNGFLTVDKMSAKCDFFTQQGREKEEGGYQKMFDVIEQLSLAFKVESFQLLKLYGEYFFSVLKVSYPELFKGNDDAFTFLNLIVSRTEALKLYPDLELPMLEIEVHSQGQLVMLYENTSGVYTFVEGLIQGCIRYFEEEILIERTLLAEGDTKVRFNLERQ